MGSREEQKYYSSVIVSTKNKSTTNKYLFFQLYFFIRYPGSFTVLLGIYNSVLLFFVLKPTWKELKQLVLFLLPQILFVYISSKQTIVVTSLIDQLLSCHQQKYISFLKMHKVFLLFFSTFCNILLLPIVPPDI